MDSQKFASALFAQYETLCLETREPHCLAVEYTLKEPAAKLIVIMSRVTEKQGGGGQFGQMEITQTFADLQADRTSDDLKEVVTTIFKNTLVKRNWPGAAPIPLFSAVTLNGQALL